MIFETLLNQLFQRFRSQHAEGSLPERGYMAATYDELDELKAAVRSCDPQAIAHEYGDALTNLVMVGFELGLNPLECAQKTSDRVDARLEYVRDNLIYDKSHPHYRHKFAELWAQAKRREDSDSP